MAEANAMDEASEGTPMKADTATGQRLPLAGSGEGPVGTPQPAWEAGTVERDRSKVSPVIRMSHVFSSANVLAVGTPDCSILQSPYLKEGARTGKIPQREGVPRDLRKATPTLTGDQRTHKLGNVLPGTERFLRDPVPWEAGGAAVVAFRRGKSPITADVT
jgi:hypothetical protein